MLGPIVARRQQFLAVLRQSLCRVWALCPRRHPEVVEGRFHLLLRWRLPDRVQAVLRLMLRALTPLVQSVPGLAHPATLCPPLRIGPPRRLPGNQAPRPRPPARAPFPPCRFRSSSNLSQHRPLSRYPSVSLVASLLPAASAPVATRTHRFSYSRRAWAYTPSTRRSRRLHSSCSCAGTCFKWLIVLADRPHLRPRQRQWNWMRSAAPSGSRSRALGTRRDTRPLLRSHQRPRELTQL